MAQHVVILLLQLIGPLFRGGSVIYNTHWGNWGLQKVPKSKFLLQCYFWSNYVQTFFEWCKITQITLVSPAPTHVRCRYIGRSKISCLACANLSWESFHEAQDRKGTDSAGSLWKEIQFTRIGNIKVGLKEIHLFWKEKYQSFCPIDQIILDCQHVNLWVWHQGAQGKLE